MKRKVIKLGNSTLVTTLPSKWAKNFNLKPGDEVEIAERSNELIISTFKNENEILRKEMNIESFDSNLVKRSVIALYISGYEEIVIRFKEQKIERIKQASTVSVFELIQNIVHNQLIGIEIIEQKSDSIWLKAVTDIHQEDFEVILRRIFLMVLSFGEELKNAVNTFNKDAAKNAASNHDNIARFVNFLLRILNKKGHEKFSKVPVYYYLVYKLREVSYVYKFISEEFQNFKMKPTKETIDVFNDINQSFNEFYTFYYKFSSEQGLKLLKKSREFYMKVNPMQYEKKQNPETLLMIARLSVINVALLELVETKFSLEY